MKRVISVLLILLLLVPAGCKTAQTADGSEAKAPAEPFEPHPVDLGFDVPEIKDYNGFVYTLSAALADGTENRNLSPLSVYFALAMAAEGANGKTQADLLKLLGADSLDALHQTTDDLLTALHEENDTGEVKLCNSLWMSVRCPLREAYRQRLKAQYGADAETVAFGTDAASKRISDWIKQQTNGLIEPSADAMRFDDATLAVLLNTLYFCDQWSAEFRDVWPGTFTHADGTEQSAEYLHRFTNRTYVYQGEGFLRYSVWFQSLGYMTFVLPDEDTPLSDLLGTPEKVRTLLTGGERINADVDLMLPKFAFSDRFELADVLCALGLTDAFTKGRADFSGMTDVPAHLERVIQETVIDLNEKGVEAAAYTAIIPKAAAAPYENETLPRIDFHLTRPFLFVIQTAWDDTPLFIGTVSAPGESR